MTTDPHPRALLLHQYGVGKVDIGGCMLLQILATHFLILCPGYPGITMGPSTNPLPGSKPCI